MTLSHCQLSSRIRARSTAVESDSGIDGLSHKQLAAARKTTTRLLKLCGVAWPRGLYLDGGPLTETRSPAQRRGETWRSFPLADVGEEATIFPVCPFPRCPTRYLRVLCFFQSSRVSCAFFLLVTRAGTLPASRNSGDRSRRKKREKERRKIPLSPFAKGGGVVVPKFLRRNVGPSADLVLGRILGQRNGRRPRTGLLGAGRPRRPLPLRLHALLPPLLGVPLRRLLRSAPPRC